MKEETRQTKRHSNKIEKSRCLKDIEKYNFPHRTVDIWDGLKEEVTATNIQKFKGMLNIWIYGDKTL